MSSELMFEANDAFYRWEEETGRTWLNDYDRIVWCEGYLYAKYVEPDRPNRPRRVEKCGHVGCSECDSESSVV